MEAIFNYIYDFFEKRKPLFYAVFVMLFLLFGFFCLRVKFEEDISRILPKKDRKIEKLNEVFQNSKFIDKFVLMVSMKDSNTVAEPDSLVSYATSLEEAIKTKLGSCK